MSTDVATPSPTPSPTPSRSVVVGRYARTFLDRHASLMPTFAAFVIFVVLLVGAQIHFGNFVTPLNMSALLLDNAYLLILAVGMTFVIIGGGPAGSGCQSIVTAPGGVRSKAAVASGTDNRVVPGFGMFTGTFVGSS